MKGLKIMVTGLATSEIYSNQKVHPQLERYWGNMNTIGPWSYYDEGKYVVKIMMYSYQDQSKVDICVEKIFNIFGLRMHPVS